MAMKQDSTSTTRLTTSDQHAAESAAQHITLATPVQVDVENKTPILTVQVLCPNCNATKDINIDTLWKQHNKYMYIYIYIYIYTYIYGGPPCAQHVALGHDLENGVLLMMRKYCL